LAGAIAALAVLGALAALGHDRARSGGGPTTARSTTSPAGPTKTGPVLVPAPGQALVQGPLASLHADNANGRPLPTPITITIPNRGQGGANITGVTVAGQSMAISWYGGQPLPVSGGAGIDLAGAPVTVGAGGITWDLDGAPRAILPGHYFLGAPVAVGSRGLATPRDSISFDAGAKATITTSGHAVVHLPVAAVHIDGPGRVTLQGDFEVRTSAGSRRATRIEFGPGSYAIDVSPAPGGLVINATLQGPVTFS
jgi:hypothetical protein